MEWMNRGGDQPQPAAAAPAAGGTKKAKGGKGISTTLVALVLGVVILLGAVFAMQGGRAASEASLVDNDKYQAVFLNGGQVYFGKISNLNDKYVQMSDIYYLRVNQTVQPNQTNADGTPATQNDISLVKLGCELHGPQDEMQINRAQVIFWENLKDDGQVANAVDEYKQANPNGQDCNAPQQQSTTPANTNENQ